MIKARIRGPQDRSGHRRAESSGSTLRIAVAGCAVAVVWMYRAGGADQNLVNKANVVGGLAGAAALALAVLVLWPKKPAPADLAGQWDGALKYRAEQTLRAWQRQAKDRR